MEVGTMGSRKRFSIDFKRKVVHELGFRPVEEICREYEIQKQLAHRWKKEFEVNPNEAFSGNGNIWKFEAKLAEKDRLIGQLYAENALLKKNIDFVTRLKEEEKRKRRSIE